MPPDAAGAPRSPDLSAFDLVPDPLVFMDSSGLLLSGNAAADELLGYDQDQLRGLHTSEIVHPDDLTFAFGALETVQDKPGSGTLVEIRVRHADGRYRVLEVRGRAGTLDGFDGILLAIRDLTERRRWEVTSGDAGAMQTLVQAAPVILLRLDRNGVVLAGNGALVRQLGHDLEAAIGRSFVSMCDSSTTISVEEELAIATSTDRHEFEAPLRAADGSVVPHLVRTVNLLDDEAVGAIVVVAHDIADLHSVRSKLAHQATHDDLTGLPNRALFDDRLEFALERSDRTGDPVTVLFIDLDGFKAFNDRYGHVVGDLLLRATTSRLSGQLRTIDTVARIGGDEFAIVAEGMDEVAAAQLVERIENTFAEHYVIGGASFVAEASIGAVTSRGPTDPATVMAAADRSMYADKRRKRTRHGRQVSSSSHRGSTAASQ